MSENIIQHSPRMATIRQTARAGILPEHALRQRLKTRNLPGVYAGSKFLVNVDLLMEQLDAECRANGGMTVRTDPES